MEIGLRFVAKSYFLLVTYEVTFYLLLLHSADTIALLQACLNLLRSPDQNNAAGLTHTVCLLHGGVRTNAPPPLQSTGSFTHLRSDISLSQTVVTHHEYKMSCFTVVN